MRVIGRPCFPRGLRVLLLDADASFRQVAEEQLKECSYSVTTCGTPAEAVSLLLQRHAGESTNGGQAATAVTAAGANAPAAAGAPSASEAPASQGSPFDVFIVEARLLLPDSGMSNSRKLVKLCRTLPFILMSSSPHPDEVMLGIKLGAAEFLEKPLCVLKLKNIWQHTVRRMMMTRTKQGTMKGHNPGGVGFKSHVQQHSGRACWSSRGGPHDPPSPLLGSPIDDVVGCASPGVGGEFGWEAGPEQVLDVPHSPLTSGFFNSPSSSASYEFMLEPAPPCFNIPGEEPEGQQQQQAASFTSAPAPALPSAPQPPPTLSARSRITPKRRSREFQGQAAFPYQDVTSKVQQHQGSLPPFPPPPPPLQAASHSSQAFELPPPPPLCAPGMPWCPPSLPLPQGTEWGMPMNPMATAPGISPPIFPPPHAATQTSPNLHRFPEHQGLRRVAPGSFSHPPHLPFPPGNTPSVPSANAALMPLPMHLLSAACSMPAVGVPSAGACGPVQQQGACVRPPSAPPAALQHQPQYQQQYQQQHNRAAENGGAKALSRNGSLLDMCGLPGFDPDDAGLHCTQGQVVQAHGTCSGRRAPVYRHPSRSSLLPVANPAAAGPRTVDASAAAAQSLTPSGLHRRRSLDSELEQLDLGLGSFKKVDSFVDLIQPLLAC